MKFMTLLFFIGPLLSTFTCSAKELDVRESFQQREAHRTRRNVDSPSSYFFYQQPEYPRDCKEVYEQCEGESSDGIYLIKPEGADEPFNVYCNNSIDGGGWTVFQRRMDGSVEFYRSWNEYKEGFGFLRREFWLGNDRIALLTNQKEYELRIDMNNLNGSPFFAKYNLFRISDESTKYRMVGLGKFYSSSTANRPSLNYHRNQSFTTYDRDNDGDSTQNDARNCHGGWWYGVIACDPYYNVYNSNLNGLYFAGSSSRKSINWDELPGGEYYLKYVEMKIRPV